MTHQINSPPPLLSVSNLSISFPSSGQSIFPVRDISFSVNQGECLALVGESGCGKSLSALSLIGLVPQPGKVAGGKIEFMGRDVAAMTASELMDLRGNLAGMIFQEPMSSLNPVYRVEFHLREALLSHQKLTKDEVTARAVELLREVAVPDPQKRLSAYPHELSGGLRQRVMIATAIANNPKLLIADEPTTALDVTVEAQIMGTIDELRQKRGMAVLLVTHDLGLVAQHADRLVVAYAGYTVESGTVEQVFANPLHPYTRALFGALPSGVGGKRFKPIPGTVPSPQNPLPGCPFANRCELCINECNARVPKLSSHPQGRQVRCIRVADA